MKRFHRKQVVLFAGDIIALFLVTLFGFASHQTLESAGARLLTTFLPLAAGWLLIAPWLGVYNLQRAADPRQVWRPFWAMVLAGPWAGFLRGLMLGNAAFTPLFVVVLGGFAALGMLAWRLLYAFTLGRRGV